uniref:Uncharacterized protein n=1 Tax=Molossus molossus TaxID=27622 RepID=A0A7J8I8F6_MOLMO|nr:hypothetical protein HJG59_010658 [Molossus molossus]
MGNAVPKRKPLTQGVTHLIVLMIQYRRLKKLCPGDNWTVLPHGSAQAHAPRWSRELGYRTAPEPLVGCTCLAVRGVDRAPAASTLQHTAVLAQRQHGKGPDVSTEPPRQLDETAAEPEIGYVARAVSHKGCRDCKGDGKTNPQWIYGLEPAEDQLRPTWGLISPCGSP